MCEYANNISEIVRVLCSLSCVVTTVMNVYFSIESKPNGENITLFYHFTGKIHCIIT